MKLDVIIPIEVTRHIGGSEGKSRWVADKVKQQRLDTKSCCVAVALVMGAGHLDGFARDTALGARITLLRPHTHSKLDDDNLAGCLKAVRDGVADFLGVDDGDPRLFFRYAQCKARQTGQKPSKPKRRKKGELKPVEPPKRRMVAAYDTHIRCRIEIVPAADVDPMKLAVRVLREAAEVLIADGDTVFERDMENMRQAIAQADQLATFDPQELYNV